MKHSVFVLFAFLTALCCSCKDGTSPIPWSSNNDVLSIAMADDPQSLDPRLVRRLETVTALRMLYEGLLTTDREGQVIPGIAERYALSDDNKTYTFFLRDSTWSDGTPLTAQDFVETWRSVLSPSFPAPNAYQLFLIKGAKEAKEGTLPLEAIGVNAVDDKTLVVELKEPAPYFTELVSSYFFYPVSKPMRVSGGEWNRNEVVGNGPFVLKSWKRRAEFLVKRNPHYWDAANVKVAAVSLQILDENTALQLFKAGSLDWAGSPLSALPQDAMASLKKQGLLKVASGAGTHWFRVNTMKPPFNNAKMRKAFALAINRQAIVDHITKGGQQPAMQLVPPAFGLRPQNYFSDHNSSVANALFEEALKEEGISRDALPPIALRYAANRDREHKVAQAVQQQWKKVLHVDVALDNTESQVLYDKMRTGDYQLCLGSWFADFQDPINFLEVFQFKDNPTNQTFWHSLSYARLLDRSSQATSERKRNALLTEAETELMAAMPVIPLFHSAYNYLESDRVEGVVLSPLGILDFKHAVLLQR